MRRAKSATPRVALTAVDGQYQRPPAGRSHGPTLTADELSWSRHAVAETILRRTRTGETVPQALRNLLLRLDDLLMLPCPVDGTESGCEAGELTDWVDTAVAAEILECSTEYVRRIAKGLGGRQVGRQWIIPRQNIIEHVNGKESR